MLECHDATSPAELIVIEELGLAKPGGAVDMIRNGDTSIGGRLPVNTDGGRISGWEFSGALEGARVHKALDGFGLLGSYSHTTSNLPGTDANGAATNSSLEGLSGNVWGLTGYYEKSGFQVRVAQRYRSEFTAMRHNAFKLVMDSIRAERITDMQIGYELQSGRFKGLGLLFQINNVTNTPYVVTQTVDGVTALKEYQ